MFTGEPYTIEGNQLTSVSHAQPGVRVVATVDRAEDRKLLQVAPEMLTLLKEVLDDDDRDDLHPELRERIEIIVACAEGLRAR